MQPSSPTSHLSYLKPKDPYRAFEVLKKEGYLDLKTQKILCLVSKNWYSSAKPLMRDLIVSRHIASKDLEKFTGLERLLVGNRPVSATASSIAVNALEFNPPFEWCEEHFAALGRLKNLAQLQFDNICDIKDESFRFLRPLTNLKKLSLINCSNVDGSGLCFITDLSELRDLELISQLPEDLARNGGIEAINKLAQLSSLYFGPLKSSQASILAENRCLSINKLVLDNGTRKIKQNFPFRPDLSGGRENQEQMIDYLQKFMDRLTIDQMRFIYISDHQFLKQFSNLSSLDISEPLTGNGDYQLLGDLTKLTHLAISYDQSGQAMNSCLNVLSQLSRLQSFKMQSFCALANYNWSQLSTLTRLDLKTLLPDQDFCQSIQKLTRLRALSFLTGCQEEDGGFERFSKMPCLEELTFGQTGPIDDIKYLICGLDDSDGFPKLTHLKLVNQNLAKQSLYSGLKGKPSLTTFDISTCKFRGDGFDKLKKERPNLKVVMPDSSLND